MDCYTLSINRRGRAWWRAECRPCNMPSTVSQRNARSACWWQTSSSWGWERGSGREGEGWYGWDDWGGLCEALDKVGEAQENTKKRERKAQGCSLSDLTEASGRGLSLRDYSAGVTLSFPSCFHVSSHSSDLFLSSAYGIIIAVLLLASGKYWVRN